MGWEEDFIELYTSPNIEKRLESFQMKRKYIPQKLFRYRPVTEENISYRLEEIADGKLLLSHPEKLNDPFECWSVLHSDCPETYINKSMYIDYYSKIGESEIVELLSKSDNWYDTLKSLIANKAGSLEEARKSDEALDYAIMCAIEDLNKEIRARIIEMMRFACFTTTATNLPMWYHYTEGRKGICLEYSTEDITDRYQLDSLFPVQYVDQLPDMAQMLACGNRIIEVMPVYLSFHKLNDWAYEKEWRLIYDSGHWLRKGENLPKDYDTTGAVINFIKPSKVILGTEMDTSLEKDIVDCAHENGIKVIKSKLTEYGICVDD